MIFVDTGAFVARYVRRDEHHVAALSHWNALQQNGRRCFTSNFVLDEVFTLLGRRTDYHFAAERAKSLYSSGWLTILRPLGGDELAALDLFKKFADQKVSFTDCISFVLMRRRGLKSVFGFDRHFSLAGFDLEPLV